MPLQILFLNLVTDVFPAFALGLGRGDVGIMQRPPRDPKEAIVDRARWWLLGALGAIITLVTLGAFAAALFGLRLAPDQAVTVAFVTLSLAQLWNVFNMRAPDSAVLRNEVTRNPYVWAALALCLTLIGLALWIPSAAELLGLPDPGPAGLLLGVGASLVTVLAGQPVVWAMGRDPAPQLGGPRGAET
nr:cation-translocating P-type ATPase C-terminal domain-containing protein [Palleronia pontilimi]